MVGMDILGKIVAVAVGMYLAAYLLPGALVAMANASFEGVNESVVTLMQIVLPLLGTIAIALAFFRD
jgi:hypothetical protein